MKRTNQIEELRKRIDIVDNKLVFLLAERFKITKRIISLKKKDGLAVKDGRREKFILKEAVKLGKKLKIKPDFIADIFERILEESKK